jgi:hypothetical protein
MTHYVGVPAEVIESFLQSKGFTRTVYYHEVVYTQSMTLSPNLHVKIYTSIRDGATAVRASGVDSIKVAVVYDDGVKRFGVGKFPHILRVGSEQEVLDRIQERMAAAYKRGSEWLSQQQTIRPIAHTFDDGQPRGGVMTEEEYAQLIAKRV